MIKYPSVAHGGRPAGAVPGAILGRTGVLTNSSPLVLAGGAAWVDEPRVCAGVNMRTECACSNTPVEGSDYCLPHKRHADKVDQRGK